PPGRAALRASLALRPAAAGERVAQGVARGAGDGRGGVGEVFTTTRVEDRARRVDDHPAPAGAHGGRDVAALRTDSRDQQRQVPGDRAYPRQLVRKRGADDEAELAAGVPRAGRQPGDALEQPLAADVERLKVAAAGVRRAAQQDHAAVAPGEPGLERVESHVRIDRDRVGPVALEGFAGILRGGRPDVPALGVEDDRLAGVVAVDVVDQRFELVFGARGREVGDLRLEGAGETGGGVDDRAAERQHGVGAPFQVCGQARGIRVEADAQHRVGLRPGRLQRRNETHRPTPDPDSGDDSIHTMNESLRLSPRDLWLLVLLTLSWGVNWPVRKIGVHDLPPMTFRTMTMIGGLPLLATIAHARGIPLRVPREHWGELFVLALFNLVLW